ncbi:MAG: hypothetical protein IGS23_01255 [Rivularia sp. T60_A2020_040]|nr:hypothetical protein [Rivularia sp. T60_A2020_040]
MSIEDCKNRCILPNFYIAVVLRENTAPKRFYVGQVKETDEYGIRLTLMDWALYEAYSLDLFRGQIFEQH